MSSNRTVGASSGEVQSLGGAKMELPAGRGPGQAIAVALVGEHTTEELPTPIPWLLFSDDVHPFAWNTNARGGT